MSLLGGAKNPTFNHCNINNIGRDATILKFDGDGPLSAEDKSLFVNHFAGMVVAPNLGAKLEKLEQRSLSQSICNLQRANAAYNDYASKDKKRVSCFKNTRQALLKEAGEWIFAALDKPASGKQSGPLWTISALD